MPDPQRPDPSLEALQSQLSHAANLGIPPAELLTRATDGLLQVTRAPAGIACLANPEGKTLEVVSARGIRPAAVRTLPQALRLNERTADQLTQPIRLGKETAPGLEALQAWLGAEAVAGGILLPLRSEGRLLGLLITIFRAGAEPAPPLSDASLAAFQGQLSTALQNAKVRQGLQSLNMDLLRLLTLAKILGEPLALEETLTMVAQAAKSFSAAVATVVWLADPAAKQLTRIVSLEPEGPDRLPRTRLAYGEGVAGCVAETGEALLLDDALTDPRLVSKDWAQGRGARSIYAFPLRFKDALVGVLSVWTATPLPPPQLSLLAIYCDHAALAVGHARLLRDTEVHVEQLGGLVAAAQAIPKGRRPGVVLGLISEACRRAIGAPWFSVWGASSRRRELRLLYADPADRGTPEGRKRIPYGSGLPGWTALHRRTRVTPDVWDDPLAGDADWYRKRGIRASVALPLLIDKELLGVLHLGAAAPLASEQLRLIEGYGALAAMALARTRKP